jgi:AcrR family transcriptional regulator
MPSSAKVRREGYTPANTALGRRGIHTRDRIVASAAKLFVANGFHSTSIDAIAKAVGGSRATVYQYFTGKDEIFLDLVRQGEHAVMEHGHRLGGLGPDAEGLRNLTAWLHEWAELYDRHAAVFLEFPGIGTIEGIPDSGPTTSAYNGLVTERIRAAGITGMDPAAAAIALLRISHMVNLYRYRGMFGLTSAATTSESLAIAMQLLLFPETPVDVIGANPPHGSSSDAIPLPARADTAPEPDELSPIRQDVLSASSMLFAEHGYYSVAMEDIAAAANLSRATLYRHYNNKVKILTDLTGWAIVEGRHVAEELNDIAAKAIDVDELAGWMSHYVRFHRSYSAVIRAWFDGTLAEQLPGNSVADGLGSFDVAVTALLEHAALPEGVNERTAAAVFLAVLGRMTEPITADAAPLSDYDTAQLMMLIVRRALFHG